MQPYGCGTLIKVELTRYLYSDLWGMTAWWWLCEICPGRDPIVLLLYGPTHTPYMCTSPGTDPEN